MALAFSKTKGKAESKKVPTYEFKDGEQRIRLFGDVLARYIYWVKGLNNKDIPIECLAFNRDTEKFDNAEYDYVPENYPDLKCSWAYTVNAIDPVKMEEVAVNLKKKLFAEIIDAAEALGDPTDPDTGWDIVFKRSKTGSQAFNVEYKLQVLKCKPRALSAEERELVAKAKTIDQKYPRPTAEDVLKTIKKIQAGPSSGNDEDGGSDGDVPEEAKDL